MPVICPACFDALALRRSILSAVVSRDAYFVVHKLSPVLEIDAIPAES
jgi:hypothetical protein